MNPDWISVAGGRFVHRQQPCHLRGVNFGGWLLLEDYMLGLPGTHTQIRSALGSVLGPERSDAFWAAYEDSFIGEEDVRQVAALGMNLIRLPLHQNRCEDPQHPGTLDPSALALIDRLIAWCRTHGLHVVLDLHAVPGGQARPSYADAWTGTSMFWEEAALRHRSTAFWTMLARRYRDEPVVAGYEILNEPDTQGRTRLLTDWYREVIPAIRSQDQRHLLFIQGDDYGKTLLGLDADLFADPQVVPAIHCSPPGDTADVDALLMARLGRTLDRPIFLSEYNVPWRQEDAPARCRALVAWRRMLNRCGHAYAYWSWKDFGGRANCHGVIALAAGSPWLAFLADEATASVRHQADELLRCDWRNPGSAGGLHRLLHDHAPGLSDRRRVLALQGMRRHAEAALCEQMLLPLADWDAAQLDRLARAFAAAACVRSPGSACLEGDP
jgi:hypothetical protein